MTILMINRPRPLLQLLAFLAGGFAMGITVGVIVLFVLRPALGSAHFTLPRVQIVVGAVLLVNAAVVATGVVGGERGEAICGPGRPNIRTARDAHPATAQRPFAVDGGRRGPRHRAAVRRLSRRAGAHRRLGRRGRHPVRRLIDVQRGGVRVRGDPADLLPGGPGPHPRNAVGTARLAAVAAPSRRRRPAGRGRLRAARRGVAGL